jgi:hypothetical protein
LQSFAALVPTLSLKLHTILQPKQNAVVNNFSTMWKISLSKSISFKHSLQMSNANA